MSTIEIHGSLDIWVDFSLANVNNNVVSRHLMRLLLICSKIGNIKFDLDPKVKVIYIYTVLI